MKNRNTSTPAKQQPKCSDQEWFQHIENCQQSGLGVSAWCKQLNINPKDYYDATCRLRREGYNVPETANLDAERSDVEWNRLISECIQSDMTTKVWCKKQGIDPKSYDAAVKRHREKKNKTSTTTSQREKPDRKAKYPTAPPDTGLSRSDEEWLQIFKECRESGLIARAWCKRRGIDYDVYKRAMIRLQEAGHSIAGICNSSPDEEKPVKAENPMPIKRTPKRSDQDWIKIISECRESDLIARAWCEKHNISYPTLRTVVTRLREKGYDVSTAKNSTNSEVIQSEIRPVVGELLTSGSSTVKMKGSTTVEQTLCRSDQEWLQVIKQCRGSGIPARRWCGQNDVGYSSFTAAITRLRRRGHNIPVLPRRPSVDSTLQLCKSTASKRYNNHHTDQEWLQLMEERRENGLTTEDWCKQNNVRVSTLNSAGTRLRKKGYNIPVVVNCRAQSSAEKVTEASCGNSTQNKQYPKRSMQEWLREKSGSSPVTIEVTINDMCLKINNSADPAILEQVLRILRET